MNPCILTASGRYFDFIDPSVRDIHITDIARALSRICRFTGHTAQFYSVAQHSVLVSHVVPKRFALEGLLHDASEAYLGDVSSPLKQLLPDYRDIERRVEDAIRLKFRLSSSAADSVKDADLRLLVTEKRDIMPYPRFAELDRDADAWVWTNEFSPLEHSIVPVGPDEAYDLFINRYLELT